MVTARAQTAGTADQTRQDRPVEDLGPDRLRPEWVDFWFEPWNYLDPSWHNLLPLDSGPASISLLRLGYGDLCERLGISEMWQQLPESELQHRMVRLLDCLPEALELCRALWLPAVTPDREQDRVWVQQQRLTAGLHRRFPSPQQENGDVFIAIWLLRGLINMDCPEAWGRLRLVLPREQVTMAENLPWNEQDLSWSLEINHRVVGRLGRSLWHHLLTEKASASNAEAAQSAEDPQEAPSHER